MSNNKKCLYCLKEVNGDMRCSRCRVARYCNTICQSKHWSVHKNNCQDSNSENSYEKLYQKGVNYHNQGSFRKAENLFKKLLTNLKNSGQSDHYIFLNTTKFLGNAYFSQGKYNDAEISYKQCFDKLRMLRQDDTHPDVLTLLSNLSCCLSAQKKYVEAAALSKRCYELQKSISGENNIGTINAHMNLAHAISSQDQYQEAEMIYEECLHKLNLVVGENHPHTLSTMSNLALVYRNKGRNFEADALEKKCFDRHKSILGDYHPDTIKQMMNTASSYHNRAEYKEAEKLFKECLKIRKLVLGDKHPDTLESLINLGRCCSAQHQHSEAEKLFKECLDTISDKNHPHKNDIIKSLGVTLFEQGKFQEMEEFVLKSIAMDPSLAEN